MVHSCRLCLEQNPLQESHIIPEFFYKRLYDSKHRFLIISTDSDRKNSQKQKGLRERLLCFDCEQKLSVFENYGKRILLDGRRKIDFVSTGTMKISPVDYRLARLFADSMLWRMSVSQNQFFSGFSLGVHEEKFRSSIRDQNALPHNSFPCRIEAHFEAGRFLRDYIAQPEIVNGNGEDLAQFTVAGFHFVYILRRIEIEAKSAFLNESGCLFIDRVDIKSRPLLYRRWLRFGSAVKERKR